MPGLTVVMNQAITELGKASNADNLRKVSFERLAVDGFAGAFAKILQYSLPGDGVYTLNFHKLRAGTLRTRLELRSAR